MSDLCLYTEWCSVTSAGERPQLMKIMSGMLLISAHSLETMMVRVFLLLVKMQLRLWHKYWWKNKIHLSV